MQSLLNISDTQKNALVKACEFAGNCKRLKFLVSSLVIKENGSVWWGVGTYVSGTPKWSKAHQGIIHTGRHTFLSFNCTPVIKKQQAASHHYFVYSASKLQGTETKRFWKVQKNIWSCDTSMNLRSIQKYGQKWSWFYGVTIAEVMILWWYTDENNPSDS